MHPASAYPYPRWFNEAPDRRKTIGRLAELSAQGLFFRGASPSLIKLRRLLLIATFRRDAEIFRLVRPRLSLLKLDGVGPFGPERKLKHQPFPDLLQHACWYGGLEVEQFLVAMLGPDDLEGVNLEACLHSARSRELIQLIAEAGKRLASKSPVFPNLASVLAWRGLFVEAAAMVSASMRPAPDVVAKALASGLRTIEAFNIATQSGRQDVPDSTPDVRTLFAAARDACRSGRLSWQDLQHALGDGFQGKLPPELAEIFADPSPPAQRSSAA